MVASNQIFLVMDAGTPVAAFTARLKAYLRRRLDVFINPLVYTFWDNQGTPNIMTVGAGRMNHAWSVEGRRGPQSASPLRGSCSIHSG